MKKIINLLFLFSITLNLYSQNQDFYNKKIIGIGEHHYFTENNETKFNLLNSIVKNSKYDNISIGLEFHAGLEYVISTNDTSLIREYFIFNKDRRFKKKLSVSNWYTYLLVQDLLELKKEDKQINIFCFNSFITKRSAYFTLKDIINKSNIKKLNNNYNKKLENKLAQTNLDINDTLLFHEIRKDLKSNYSDLLSKNTSLNKLINSYFYPPFSNEREKFLFQQVKEKITRNSQTVIIAGNGHIRKSEDDNLYNKLAEKYNSFFIKKVYTIGIIPKKQTKDEFDSYRLIGNDKYFDK